MPGALLGIFVLALVGGAGVVVGMVLGVRSIAELALAAYVVGFAEVVGLSLFLSTFGALTRTGLVAGVAMFFAGAIGVWMLAGAHRIRIPPRDALRPLMRIGPVAVLVAVVALALAYVVALIVGTAPNGWDQLNYHLARAALWLDSERVGYVQAAYDERINSYPPNGEIGLAFALDVTRNEIFAGAVQLAAALACAVGVFAIARRLSLDRREAVFGALLFLALPIVLLQASSTKNDIVVASFLVAAAVFVLRDSRSEICLASLATALAVGTKFTAFYGGLVLLALALVASPGSRRTLRIVAIAAGAGLGLYWYAVNAVETGMFLGDTSNIPGLTAPLRPRENLLEVLGLAVDWIDLSGAKGADILFYLGAAFLVAAGFTFLGTPSAAGRRRSAIVAFVLVASPLLLYVLTTRIGRPGLVKLHDVLGEPQAYIPSDGDPNSSPALASDTGSWFGPVGLLLAIGVGVAAVILVRRGSLSRPAAVCAAAPLVWTVVVALSLTYHPWQGRFFLFPVALSASLWGLTLRAPPVAWGATALSAVTASLALVHYMEKPSGIRLLDRAHAASIWTLERWEVQSQHDPTIGPVLRFLDDEVPARDSIALALGANDFGYPAFGPRLERAVELVPFGSSGREVRTTWLLANPERASEIDRACWGEAFESENGTVFRRHAC